jgi:hypothetical protein
MNASNKRASIFIYGLFNDAVSISGYTVSERDLEFTRNALIAYEISPNSKIIHEKLSLPTSREIPESILSHPIQLRQILMLSSYLSLDLSSCLLPSVILHKYLYALLICPI